MQWSLATVALLPRGVTSHAAVAEQRSTIEWAARVGFRGIEISPQWLNIDDWQPAELSRFGREANAAGLAISGINVNRCLFLRGEAAEGSLDRIRRAMDGAAILGSRCVTLSLSVPLGDRSRPVVRGSDYSSEDRDRATATLRELARNAASDGIEISLELHDDGLLDTADYCLDMVRRVAAPNVGVNPDLGNFVRTSGQADQWPSELEKLAPLANNWHVKNYRQGAAAPLWDGEIDYLQAMRTMRHAGYYGWVSIESYSDDPRDLQERSLDYLRRTERQLSEEEQAAAV